MMDQGFKFTRRKSSAAAASPPSTGLEVSTLGLSAAPAAESGAAMGVGAVGGLGTRVEGFGFRVWGLGIAFRGGWRCHEGGRCRHTGVGIRSQA